VRPGVLLPEEGPEGLTGVLDGERMKGVLGAFGGVPGGETGGEVGGELGGEAPGEAGGEWKPSLFDIRVRARAGVSLTGTGRYRD